MEAMGRLANFRKKRYAPTAVTAIAKFHHLGHTTNGERQLTLLE